MTNVPSPEQASAYLTELSKLDDAAVQAIIRSEIETMRGIALPDEPMLKFFAFSHLPEPLQSVSFIFCETACRLVTQVPRSAERTVALRKLLEAKDAGVRAMLP